MANNPYLMLCRFKRKENKVDSVWTGMGIRSIQLCGQGSIHFPCSVFFVFHIEDNVLNKFGGVELLIVDIWYLFCLGIFDVKFFTKLISDTYLANP